MGDLRGRVVGILNGHPNGAPVLRAMHELLLSDNGVARVLFRTKPWVSRPAPDLLLHELRGSCDAVISGIGDEARARRGVSTTGSRCTAVVCSPSRS